MHRRIIPITLLALMLGCPPLPEFVTCEEEDACGTTQPGSTGNSGPPTTSDGVNTVTGDEADASTPSNAGCSAGLGDASFWSFGLLAVAGALRRRKQ